VFAAGGDAAAGVAVAGLEDSAAAGTPHAAASSNPKITHRPTGRERIARRLPGRSPGQSDGNPGTIPLRVGSIFIMVNFYY
jgi:hypothetical protein